MEMLRRMHVGARPSRRHASTRAGHRAFGPQEGAPSGSRSVAIGAVG